MEMLSSNINTKPNQFDGPTFSLDLLNPDRPACLQDVPHSVI